MNMLRERNLALLAIGLLLMVNLQFMSPRAVAASTVTACQTSSDGGAYAWDQGTGDTYQYQEEY